MLLVLSQLRLLNPIRSGQFQKCCTSELISFSSLSFLEAFDAFLNEAQHVDELQGKDYITFRDTWSKFSETRFPPDIVKSLSFYLIMEQYIRSVRARLQVLRAVAHLRATGQIPQVNDPFGTKILHSMTEDGVTIWSAEGCSMP